MKTRKGLAGFLGTLGLAAASVLGSGEKAKADGSRIAAQVNTGITQPYIRITQRNVSGVSEELDSYDSEFVGIPSGSTIDFYSNVSFDPFKLQYDTRPLTSLSTINEQIIGRDLSGSVSGNLSLTITDPYNQHAFDTKNIYLALSDTTNHTLGIYDVKKLDLSGTTIPITVNNGLSYNADFSFTSTGQPYNLTSLTPSSNLSIGASTSVSASSIISAGSNINVGGSSILSLTSSMSASNLTLASSSSAFLKALVLSGDVNVGANGYLQANYIQAHKLALAPGSKVVLGTSYIYETYVGSNSVASANYIEGHSLSVAPGGLFILGNPSPSPPTLPVAGYSSYVSAGSNTPEPSTLALLAGAGLAGAVGWVIRNSRRKYTGIEEEVSSDN